MSMRQALAILKDPWRSYRQVKEKDNWLYRSMRSYRSVKTINPLLIEGVCLVRRLKRREGNIEIFRDPASTVYPVRLRDITDEPPRIGTIVVRQQQDHSHQKAVRLIIGITAIFRCMVHTTGQNKGIPSLLTGATSVE